MTKNVEMEVKAEFTVATTKLASLSMFFNPLIKFQFYYKKSVRL